MAKARITRGAVAGGNRAMSDLTTIQMRVAEASALIDAVRLMMSRDLAEAQATVERGEPMGDRVHRVEQFGGHAMADDLEEAHLCGGRLDLRGGRGHAAVLVHLDVLVVPGALAL